MLKTKILYMAAIDSRMEWVNRIYWMLLVGGLLQIGYCGVILLDGIINGDPSALSLAAGISFLGAILLIDGAVISLGRRMYIYAPALITGSVICAGISILLTGLAFIAFDRFGIFAEISSLVAVTLLGGGLLRGKAVPRHVSLSILSLGALTFLFILVFSIQIGEIPLYVTSEMPFTLAGIAWMGIAVMLKRVHPTYFQ